MTIGSNRSNNVLAGIAITCLLLSLTAASTLGQNLTDQDFERALEQARGKSGSLNNSLIKPSDGSLIPLVKKIESLGSGKYKAYINGAWLTSSSSYKTVTYVGVFQNHGDRFEYEFLGQPVPKHLVQGVRDHKGMVKAEKTWIKKHEDTQVIVGVNENRISLAGALSYNGLKNHHVADRMELLFKASNGVLVWTEYALRDVREDYEKNLSRNKLTFLSKSDLLNLTGDGIADFEKESKGVEHGYFDFKNKGRNIRVFNYGDRVMLTFHRRVPDTVKGDDREALLSELQEFVSKKNVKGATSQDARWYNLKKPTFVWVRVHFELDGTLKGEDFNKAYWKFKDDFAKDVEKELVKLIEKHES